MEALKTALLTVTDKVYHFIAPPNTAPAYIVWAEDGANDLVANNRHIEKVWTGSVDLYTDKESDPFVTAIPVALENAGAAYSLVMVEYEEETSLIHYSWDWEMM